MNVALNPSRKHYVNIYDYVTLTKKHRVDTYIFKFVVEYAVLNLLRVTQPSDMGHFPNVLILSTYYIHTVQFPKSFSCYAFNILLHCENIDEKKKR